MVKNKNINTQELYLDFMAADGNADVFANTASGRSGMSYDEVKTLLENTDLSTVEKDIARNIGSGSGNSAIAEQLAEQTAELKQSNADNRKLDKDKALLAKAGRLNFFEEGTVKVLGNMKATANASMFSPDSIKSLMFGNLALDSQVTQSMNRNYHQSIAQQKQQFSADLRQNMMSDKREHAESKFAADEKKIQDRKAREADDKEKIQEAVGSKFVTNEINERYNSAKKLLNGDVQSEQAESGDSGMFFLN